MDSWGINENPIVRHKIIKYYLSKLFPSVIVNYILEFISNEGHGTLIQLVLPKPSYKWPVRRNFVYMGYFNVTQGTVIIYNPYHKPETINGVTNGGKVVIKDSDIFIDDDDNKILLKELRIN